MNEEELRLPLLLFMRMGKTYIYIWDLNSQTSDLEAHVWKPVSATKKIKKIKEKTNKGYCECFCISPPFF